eukprot:10349542-Alexandrium_andersonii.AAC.1
MAGGALTAEALGMPLSRTRDILQSQPANQRWGNDGTWHVTDADSWAILARKWIEWKERGDLALLGTNALMSLRQIFNEEGHRSKLLTMAAEELLSMNDNKS